MATKRICDRCGAEITPAVPVVRCKDCKYSEYVDFAGDTLFGCTRSGAMGDIGEECFCSYGERKDGD